jgi:hypothetical protein
VEAKRLGYYPSIIHSDRGSEFTNTELERYCNRNTIRQRFSDAYTPQQNGLAKRFNRTILESLKTILLDSGLRKNLWSEVLSASTLTLNQVPTHRSKKSPYELFKGISIPIDYFHPIGNPVAVLSAHKKKPKLEPRGKLGRLIGFNPEIKSYRILTDDGQIINSKSVDFLDFRSSPSSSSDDSNVILVKEKVEKPLVWPDDKEAEEEKIEIKQEEVESLSEEEEDQSIPSHSDFEDDPSDDNEAVANALNPESTASTGRVLRDRTLQVRPVKYSHFTEEPKSFKKAITCADAEKWRKAIDGELDNIEQHDVWDDQWEKPLKNLNSTWVFKTKPATNSSV